jgi:hypothetical protein
MNDFAPHMLDVARSVWGEPNRRLSTPMDVRWGTGGSKSVDLRKGTWYDHEQQVGGGILKLLEVEKGMKNGKAFEYLRSIGVEIPKQEAVQLPERSASASRRREAAGSGEYEGFASFPTASLNLSRRRRTTAPSTSQRARRTLIISLLWAFLRRAIRWVRGSGRTS